MMHTPDYYRELQERERKSGPCSLTADEMGAVRSMELCAPDMLSVALHLLSGLPDETYQAGKRLRKEEASFLNGAILAAKSAILKMRRGG